MALTTIKTGAISDDAVTEDKIANAINTARAANTAKDLTALSASNLTSGTVPDARFPATLPAASATNLTSIPAGNLTGTVADARISTLTASKLTGALPAISAASCTNIPAANITGTLPAISGANLTNLPGGGKVLQVVQFTTHGTNNYSSENFQNTVVAVDITPTDSSSKFLIKSVIHFGIGAKDCAVSFNWSDSLHASGTTHPIAPMSTDGSSGASSSRLPAYWGHGCYDDDYAIDNFFIGNATGEYLYTPASASSSQRTFTVMVRSAFGRLVRFSMNAHLNSANPRDMRPTNSITVMEIGT